MQAQLKPALKSQLFNLRLLTARQRSLPDYLLIGVMRGGTSFFYNHIVQHPAVAPAFKKEIRYFCGFGGNYERGLNWYRAHFPIRWPSGRQSPRVLSGEATPYYIFHPDAPRRVAQAIPQVRLIVLLRNPVDRAYSHYNKNVNKGLDSASFAQAVAALEAVPWAEASRIAVEGLEQRRPDWLQRRPTSYPRLEHAHNNAYLCWGVYVRYLRHWFQTFPREQFLILRSEDMYARPAETMAHVYRFLDIAPTAPATFRRSYKPRDYRPLDADLRQRLLSYYRPHNEELAALLGRDMEWES